MPKIFWLVSQCLFEGINFPMKFMKHVSGRRQHKYFVGY